MDKANWKFPAKLDFLFQPSRYKIAYGGRGGAKSWGFGRALLIEGWRNPERILCAREVQKSIKDSVHKLLSDQIQELGLGHHYEVLQNEIRGANGTEIIFSGLSNQTAESIKSFEGVTKCWVEEAHKVSRRSWDILIPTIRAPNSEIWVSLNPELDSDETWVRFIENPPVSAKTVEINWRDNPWFPPVLEDERLEMLRQVSLGIRSQDDYDNIWEGKCKSAVDGAIYFREVQAAKLAGRVREVPYDPLLKVHRIFDLGWNDKMAIGLVQRAASEVRIIQYIEDSHRTLAEYDEQFRKMPYRWGKTILPHDGQARDYKSGRSAEEILRALGHDVEIAPNVNVEQGIQAARMMFPRCYFDRESAGALFNRLGRYKRRIQSNNEPGGPEHDENSHGADMFRYIAVSESLLSNEDSVIDDPYKGFRRYG